MSKREASMFAAQGIDIDAPRAKRHKHGPATAAASSPPKDERIASHGEQTEGDVNVRAIEDPEQVKERGLQLWQVIKDAANKEGRILSHDFLRLPSKRQYPDYYVQIKRPIALDDIKRQLDSGQYAFFGEVKQDFEQCFKNAKKYNIKESQIWKDAKFLHKLVLKESEKLTGIVEGADVLGDKDVDAAGSDAEADEGKRKKGPNMYRLLKTRLQKLISKTDDAGRVVSAEFMELPNKRQWPSYYKVIRRPQCFENIFKHLKRKEYETVSDFASDVELVFSNALEFNQEHTQIWEDAIVLRDHFRQLMSDLPAPFIIPAYASADHSMKIKLRMPATHHASTGSTSQAVLPIAVQSPKLHIPALSSSSTAVSNPLIGTSILTNVSALPTGGRVSSSGGSSVPSSSAPAPPQTPQLSQPVTSAQSAAYNQTTYNGTHSQHYPNAIYQSPANPPHAITSSQGQHSTVSRISIQPVQSQAPLQAQTAASVNLAMAKSPTPLDAQNQRQLCFVLIMTKPLGRMLSLDYGAGVKTWAVRLGKDEIGIRVSDVRFSGAEGDGEDSDDENKGKEKETETERHEDGDEEEEEESPQEKPKRGRGRPRKKLRTKATESPKGKEKAVIGSPLPSDGVLQLRLNGAVLESAEVEKSAWDVDLQVGSNVLEIGETGGQSWRLYLERLAYI